MKKTSYILNLIIAISFFSFNSFSQDTLFEKQEEFEHLFCGSEEAKALRGKENSPLLKSLTSPLDPSTYIICGNGKFRVIFMDLVNSTGAGFAAPGALGIARRNCVCEVINYIESVISIPANIGTTSPTIDIIFNVSINSASNILAFATPVFDAAFYAPTPTSPSPGYYGGYMYDYINTGIKSDILSEDAQVTVNFGHQYAYCTPTLLDCDYDFYSIILHELTHSLGFLSFGQDIAGTLSSKITNNVFSKLDEHYLYYNSGAGFLKLFDITSFPPNGVNPSLPLNAGADNNVWLTDSDLINKQNQPINSDSPYNAGTSLSHLDDRYHLNLTVSGLGRTDISPGYSPNYLMNGSINSHQKKREFTLQEVLILQTMGYTINPTFPGLSNISNNTPYHQGVLITPNDMGATSYFNSTPASGLSDLTINTTNGNPVTLNLTTGIMTNGSASQALNFTDLDGDVITVYEPNPGWKGLYNIRGCGSGNNEDQLTINANRDIITFTPRNNFIGRAQFAFHLYDGKQRGDYIVITVDVTKGTTFLNTPSDELVINGSFEEGSEYQEIGTNEFNLFADEVNTYKMYTKKTICDGMQYYHQGWNDPNLINSSKNCLFTEGYLCYGNCSGTSIPLPSNLGNRFMSFMSANIAESFNMQLTDPIINCTSYTIEFDLNIPSLLAFVTNFSTNPNPTINFLFHNQGLNTNINFGQENLNISYPVSTANIGT